MGPYQGGQAEYLRAPFADLAMLSDIVSPGYHGIETADGEADNTGSVHPDEPAEGGEDGVEESGTDRPDNAA